MRVSAERRIGLSRARPPSSRLINHSVALHVVGGTAMGQGMRQASPRGEGWSVLISRCRPVWADNIGETRAAVNRTLNAWRRTLKFPGAPTDSGLSLAGGRASGDTLAAQSLSGKKLAKNKRKSFERKSKEEERTSGIPCRDRIRQSLRYSMLSLFLSCVCVVVEFLDRLSARASRASRRTSHATAATAAKNRWGASGIQPARGFLAVKFGPDREEAGAGSVGVGAFAHTGGRRRS